MKLYKRKENDQAPVGQADPYLIKGDDGRYYLGDICSAVILLQRDGNMMACA